MEIKYPWDRGNEGWDHYSDFESWLLDQLPEHEEWVEDAPTVLMAVFYNLGRDIERQFNASTSETEVDNDGK